MNAVEESISGIEKLIGFIYRILFTLIPSGAFLCISFLFLKFNFPNTIDSINELFSGIHSFWQVLLPLCLIFSFSLLLESMDLLLFYYVMDFGNLSSIRIFKLKERANLKKLKNKDLNALYNLPENDSSIKRIIEHSHYTLGLVKSLMNHPRVFSHIYYQLGREFVFNNLTVVFLLIANFFAPYVVASYFSHNFNFNHFWFYQALQPILSIIYLWVSYRLLKKYNDFKNHDSTPDFSFKKFFPQIFTFPYIFFAILSLLIVFGSFVLPLAFKLKETHLLFIAFNFFMFPVILSMVFRGFKEYLNVEKYYLAYFVEKHFLKSRQ
ncbi:MAG: hypothetical protein IPI96_14965 [Saprospiraceae bacterium]|nr:hypothetical protein [Saprospiraceae bacterium]